MQGPNIAHRVHLQEDDVWFVVMAYRQLSDGEVDQRVRHYLRITPRKNWPARGETITLLLSDQE
jgi:hypothetical protein